MAPTITSTADHPKDYMSLSHKVRKPIVEKLRRDRINNSIEELKALLGPQLQNQQPESKLEKADILEMTVCLLRKKLQQKTLPFSNVVAAGQRFSMCPQKIPVFPSKEELQGRFSGAMLNHFQILKTSSDEDTVVASVLPQQNVLNQHNVNQEKIPANSAPWRPW
ncbi:transcription factor HES-5-like [Engraulis encrasicolus]|uniref:transcription factor HES-5-like n=1 Tax=Engraulis encrasicolus TaxID=184585 RepID=UPI002FD410E0